MRVVWYKSLVGKISLLVAGCLLATVAVMSWQGNAMFTRFLGRQIEDGTVNEAKDTSERARSTLDGWSGQAALAVHSMSGTTPAAFQRMVRNVVIANPDIVALQVFSGRRPLAYAFTDATADVRFEDRKPAVIDQLLRKLGPRWLPKLAGMREDGLLLRNIGREAKLPLLMLARRFRGPEDKPLWAVLTTWQTRLLEALPANAGARASLLGENGTILIASGDDHPDAADSRADARLFHTMAQRLGAPFGFKAYDTADKLPRLGAFARITRYGMTAVVTRDARPGYMAVRQIVLQTALWAWVILLAAVTISILSISGVTRGLKASIAATVRIAGGDFSVNLQPKTRDEVGLLGLAVNHMSSQIVDLLQARVAAARQEQELVTARLVQEMLFPSDGLVKRSGLTVSARCLVASECGGDWWGHFETEDGLHYVLIADATGHGAPAALVTALAYATCMTLAESWRKPEVHQRSAAPILTMLNQLLCNAGKGKTTMTMLVMMIDPATGDWKYASAAHNMPLKIEAPGEDNQSRVRTILCRGTPLGMEKDAVFEEQAGRLVPGDKLFLYTDGLIEGRSPGGRQLGKKAVERVLKANAAAGAETVRDAVLNNAFGFFAGQPIDDDLTVVVIELDDAKPQQMDPQAA